MKLALATMLSAFTSIPSPPITLSVTEPETPPPVIPVPAITPVTVPPIVFTSTNDKVPLPSVVITWLALPSAVGYVNPATSNPVLLINSNLFDLSLASIVCVPAF